MAARKTYPRATLKRIVKAHSNKKLSQNADVLVYLDYVLFLRALVQEAEIQARVSAGNAGASSAAGGATAATTISGSAVRKVTDDVLRRFRG